MLPFPMQHLNESLVKTWVNVQREVWVYIQENESSSPSYTFTSYETSVIYIISSHFNFVLCQVKIVSIIWFCLALVKIESDNAWENSANSNTLNNEV